MKPWILVDLNSWLMKNDSMDISNKIVQLQMLKTTQWECYKSYSMTETSVQNCGLQDQLNLMFVIFICGTDLKGKCTGTTLALLKPSRKGSGMWLLQRQTSFSMFHRDSFDNVRCLRTEGDHVEPFVYKSDVLMGIHNMLAVYSNYDQA
jgi:hypothetical protein